MTVVICKNYHKPKQRVGQEGEEQGSEFACALLAERKKRAERRKEQINN